MQFSGEPFPYQLCLLGSFLALLGLPAAASKLSLFQGTLILLGYYLHFFLQTFRPKFIRTEYPSSNMLLNNIWILFIKYSDSQYSLTNS